MPELMLATGAELPQAGRRNRWPGRVGSKTGIRHNPQEPVLRERARGPSCFAMLRKPIMGHFMMDVVWIKEGDKDVDVEEGDTRHRFSLRL